MARTSTDTKEKLLETAIELIWQSNYSNVGVNEICERAGVTKGSFYHYFETKADLFYAASQFCWDNIKDELEAIFCSQQPPLEQLEGLINFVISRQSHKKPNDDNPVCGCPIFTSGGQSGVAEEKIQLAAKEMCDRAVNYNSKLIQNLQAGGYLAGSADAVQVGRILYQYIQGMLIYARIHRSLEIINSDLREGIYRIVNLKNEYRINK